MYPPSLSRLVSQAVVRLQADMTQAGPTLAAQLGPWLATLSGTTRPEDYFQHPLAFPALLLPWWLESSLVDTPDAAFQADLIYSTLNGYYHIRLIDNVMDGHATIEPELLPGLAFFHTQFQAAYQPHFTADHPFWRDFKAIWFHAAEVTMQDAGLTTIGRRQFEQISAQKICPANIPLAAVCYRYRRPDLFEAWAALVDRLGCWHQLHNDLFDWPKDLTHQTVTYVLSEAERRRQPDEPVPAWIAREGFDWGIDLLHRWLEELHRQAEPLACPDLLAYLSQRQAMLAEQSARVRPGLQSLAAIAQAMR